MHAASMLDLAGALFDAAKGAEPTRQTILFLDGLLRDQQPEPCSSRRSSSDNSPTWPAHPEDADWPTETVPALKVTSQAEQANSRSETLDWLRRPLEEAAQVRHNAEVILLARGFAAIEEADRLYRVAECALRRDPRATRRRSRSEASLARALHFLPHR